MNAPETIRATLQAHQPSFPDRARCTCGTYLTSSTTMADHQALHIIRALMGLVSDDDQEPTP